jgi:hypothetical protein
MSVYIYIYIYIYTRIYGIRSKVIIGVYFPIYLNMEKEHNK